MSKSALTQLRRYRFFFKNWWVAFFLTALWMTYLHSFDKKKEQLAVLLDKQANLQREKKSALALREILTVRAHSYQDPESLELVLKERLGVVEPGEVKVIFHRASLKKTKDQRIERKR